jgi:hypothetical protein
VPRPTPLRTVVCGPCWAEHGGQATAGEIGPPPPIALGSRDPECEKEWLDRLFAQNWVQLLRVDTRRKLRRLARKLAVHANWETAETFPTWSALMSATGWARSTMAGWLRQLRLLGWLGLVERGSTPQFRPMALATDVEGNRAAVYRLRIPLRLAELPLAVTDLPEPPGAQRGAEPVAAAPESQVDQAVRLDVGDETWTPTTPVKDLYLEKVGGSSRARDFFHSSYTVTSVSTEVIEALRARLDEGEGWAWDEKVPASRGQMLAAACELRRQHPTLARLSGKAVRALCRPYWRASWTNGDVLHGLVYRPNSWWYSTSCPAEQVYAPAGWAASRLAAWRTPDGRVLPGYSAHQAEAQRVRDRHGQGAVDALPAGAVRFRPDHVLVRARAVAGYARETIERRWRRERADELARVRPITEAADSATRAARTAECRQALSRSRVDWHDTARRDAHRDGPDQQVSAVPVERATAGSCVSHADGSGRTPEEIHRTALQRARAERGRRSGQFRGRS